MASTPSFRKHLAMYVLIEAHCGMSVVQGYVMLHKYTTLLCYYVMYLLSQAAA